jgi:soluble lytic murein transglycosylase
MLLNNVSLRGLKRIISFLFALIIILFVVGNVAKMFFPLKFKDYVFKYSMENSLDPYLVFAVIKVESSFNPRALSPGNARGLMQLTEKTAVWGAESIKIKDFSVNSLFDPEINIRLGCWYLNRLMEEFDGDIDLVIAAYNAGSGNVSKWLKDRNYSSSGINLDRIPFRETENYVRKVKNNLFIYKKLYETSF